MRPRLKLVQSKPLPTAGLRAAIYCRVSKEDVRDTKHQSVKHQRGKAVEYAQEKGWTVR
jgi:DNA invertase Pin-like site-specific DNA recombinase